LEPNVMDWSNWLSAKLSRIGWGRVDVMIWNYKINAFDWNKFWKRIFLITISWGMARFILFIKFHLKEIKPSIKTYIPNIYLHVYSELVRRFFVFASFTQKLCFEIDFNVFSACQLQNHHCFFFGLLVHCK
jgi:hypothetical protein